MPVSGIHLISSVALAILLAPFASAQILTTEPPPLARWDHSAVKQIADEIQNTTERARLTASAQTRPSRREQAAALTDLTTLAAAARHFSTGVERFRDAPDPTRQDYLALVSAYSQARANVADAGYDANVMQEFNRVGLLLDRLSLVYAQRWDRGLAVSAAEAMKDSLVAAHNVARQRARDNPSDQRVVFLLGRLAQAATFLRRQLDSEPDPLAIGEDFRMIMNDYVLLMRSLQPASFSLALEPELNRASQALVQLRRAYEVPWNGVNARTIADQIRVSAQHVLDATRQRAEREPGEEPQALDNLRLMVLAAHRLVHQLEVRPETPIESYPDFLTLAAAYNQSSPHLMQAWFDRQTLAAVSGLGQQIAYLNRMYSRAAEREPAHLTGTVIGR